MKFHLQLALIENIYLFSVVQLTMKILTAVFLLCFGLCVCTLAQSNRDSLQQNKKHLLHKWIQQGMKTITRHSHDTTDYRAAYNSRVVTYYQPYEGKVIRNIDVRQFGFERSFSDTMNRIKYFGTNLLNHLHTRSKSWVIRNNLFIKPGMPLNPNVVADNERYLRSLNFIRDARILVETIGPNSDSVDLMVVTKDLFSLSAEVHNLSSTKQYVNISDVNFLGLGQGVSLSFLQDQNRHTRTGGEFSYTKYNLFNSFTSLGFRYTNIGKNIYSRRQEEHGAYLNADRPLYSQYTSYYWNLHLSDVWSESDYEPLKDADTTFYRYRYKMFDATFGYNLDAKKGAKQY
ncbi:MAG TPA: hypothetical protein VGB84_09395 [Arachidicoccus sp.]